MLLVAGEAAYWRIAAERVRTGYQAWVREQVASGWDVGSGPVSIGGWPGSAVVTVPNLTLHHAGPMLPGDVSVAFAGVRLAVSLLNPTGLGLSLTGPAHVRAGGLPDVIVTGDETSMVVPLQQTGAVDVALHASGLRLEAATGAWHVTIGLLNARAAIAAGAPSGRPDQSQVDQSQVDQSQAGQSQADESPGATFAVTSEAIALPAGIKWPLGPNISSLSVDGRLNGPLPETREITRWAEAWRDGGGSLEITHLTVGWGPLGLTSSATLALDDQLQPMGSGNGRFVGYAETLDRLAAGGMLTKSAATAAKAVLSLIAGTSDTDEPSAVDVPLTLQYRTLSMRQVPLLRLPEVDWPRQ